MNDFTRGSMANPVMPKSAESRRKPIESPEDRRDRKSAKAYRVGSILLAVGPIIVPFIAALISPGKSDPVIHAFRSLEGVVCWVVAGALAVCHEVVISRREARHLAQSVQA